jgi:hypothetical protein
MGLLSREKLLQRQQLPMEKVEFDNGDYVFVRAMTGYDRGVFEQSILKEKLDAKGEFIGYDRANDNFRGKLAVLTICDENGDLLLEPGDYDLFSKSISIVNLEKIIEMSQRLNVITPKDKEDLTKNLSAGDPGNSNSNSAGN